MATTSVDDPEQKYTERSGRPRFRIAAGYFPGCGGVIVWSNKDRADSAPDWEGAMLGIGRREVMTLLGSAAVWPVVARAQQPAFPVIGFLHAGSPEEYGATIAGFRKGLSETGFAEGRNLSIEYRWANNRFDRLPELAAELVGRQVTVIATPSGTAAALAAKAATLTILIVFGVAVDPIRTGLVTRFNRPGGNITGVNYMSGDVASKRLGLVHELLAGAKRFGVLVNPTSPLAPFLEDMRPVASAFGGEIDLLTASTNGEIDTAFASLAERRIDALLLTTNTLFTSRRVQIVTLAARLGVPVIYTSRVPVEIGGLMSYGTNNFDQDRVTGIYVGRVLKGEKPADLPVIRATKFEFVINLQTARTLGLDVPPNLLAIADAVIE